MTTEHAVLDGIRSSISATGSHSHRWGDLRRDVFQGPEAWTELKAWCAANAFECAIAFGQSSRKAEVQFGKLRKA